MLGGGGASIIGELSGGSPLDEADSRGPVAELGSLRTALNLQKEGKLHERNE